MRKGAFDFGYRAPYLFKRAREHRRAEDEHEEELVDYEQLWYDTSDNACGMRLPVGLPFSTNVWKCVMKRVDRRRHYIDQDSSWYEI